MSNSNCSKIIVRDTSKVHNVFFFQPKIFTTLLRTGHSGFMGYGDLWGFISQNLFIINPCLDLWGFMESPWVIWKGRG